AGGMGQFYVLGNNERNKWRDSSFLCARTGLERRSRVFAILHSKSEFDILHQQRNYERGYRTTCGWNFFRRWWRQQLHGPEFDFFGLRVWLPETFMANRHSVRTVCAVIS